MEFLEFFKMLGKYGKCKIIAPNVIEIEIDHYLFKGTIEVRIEHLDYLLQGLLFKFCSMTGSSS